MPEWRHVLTVRNPYDAYQTHRIRYPSNTDMNFAAMWGHYIWRTSWQDAFYFALDVVPENRRAMLQELVQFCGETPNFEVIDEYAEKWEKVGATTEEKQPVPKEVIKALAFAHEWYEHYTVFWGARFRDSQNILGEGD